MILCLNHMKFQSQAAVIDAAVIECRAAVDPAVIECRAVDHVPILYVSPDSCALGLAPSPPFHPRLFDRP